MAEKLTKRAIRDELNRRVAWYEQSYGFTHETRAQDVENNGVHGIIAFGQYRSLRSMIYQVEKRMFIGGYCA